MSTTKTNSPTPTYYACGRTLYERGNDDKPAAECRSDADALLLASQSSRIAELEAALERMCTLFEQEGPRDAHEWAGAKAARALLAKMEGR